MGYQRGCAVVLSGIVAVVSVIHPAMACETCGGKGKLSEMHRVQVNGYPVIDSQVKKTIMGEVSKYLGQEITVGPRSQSQRVEGATLSTVSTPVKKLPQMTRVVANDQAIVDSQYPERIIEAVEANLGKNIQVKPRQVFLSLTAVAKGQTSKSISEASKALIERIALKAEKGRVIESGKFGIGSDRKDILEAGNPDRQNGIEGSVLQYGDVEYMFNQEGRVYAVTSQGYLSGLTLPNVMKVLGKPSHQYSPLRNIRDVQYRTGQYVLQFSFEYDDQTKTVGRCLEITVW